eukprot:1393081-Amorphochlora_amoeboformis.AAC.2
MPIIAMAYHGAVENLEWPTCQRARTRVPTIPFAPGWNYPTTQFGMLDLVPSSEWNGVCTLIWKRRHETSPWSEISV